MRFKITHTKTSTNPVLSLKIGQTILTANRNLPKTLQPLQLTNAASTSTFKEQRKLQVEAELKQNQARTYASITPIR